MVDIQQLPGHVRVVIASSDKRERLFYKCRVEGYDILRYPGFYDGRDVCLGCGMEPIIDLNSVAYRTFHKDHEPYRELFFRDGIFYLVKRIHKKDLEKEKPPVVPRD